MMTLSGIGASPGRAAGPPLIVGDEGEGAATAGAVLVGRVIHPHQAPLFLSIAGVVTEDGGALQHAAILAREFGVPAVVGVADAVTRLATARVIRLDGTTGVVTFEV